MTAWIHESFTLHERKRRSGTFSELFRGIHSMIDMGLVAMRQGDVESDLMDYSEGDIPDELTPEHLASELVDWHEGRGGQYWLEFSPVFPRIVVGDLQDAISAHVHKYGWFVNTYGDGGTVNIEPIWGKKLKRSAIPKEMWHTTPERNVEGIMKRGLIPSRGGRGRTYPQRIHLLTDPKFLEELQSSFKNYDLGEHAVIRVDVERLMQDQGMNFYLDPDMTGSGDTGVYTYSHIPPEYLSK